MKNSLRKRLMVAGVILMIATTSVTGCGVGDVEVVWSQNLGGNTIFRIGSKTCELHEAKIFMATYRVLYEDIYGNKVWNQKHNGKTLEDYVKSVTLTELAKMKSLVLLAEKQKEKLSEQELKMVSGVAEQYYQSLSKDEKKYFGVTQTDVLEMYTDYALATKIYTKLTGGVKEEVSDNDARVMKVRQIVVGDEESAKTVEKKLAQGQDFGALASYYNGSFSVETLLYKQKMSDVMAKELERLDEGEVSSCINDNGKYYFFQVVTKIDRELTEENKLVIVKERATKAFDDVYDNFVDGLSSSYNDEVWESFHMDNNIELSKVSFFELFNEQIDFL